MKRGDYFGLGEAIDREAAIIEEQQQSIEAQHGAIEEQVRSVREQRQGVAEQHPGTEAPHLTLTTGTHIDLSPHVLIASSFLPGVPPRDPTDRILAATAHEYCYRLMTRDTPLLTYARQGHLQALAC